MTDTVTESATADDQAEPSLESAAVEQKLIEQLVAQARSKGLQLTGVGGLLQQLTKTVLESALEGEIGLATAAAPRRGTRSRRERRPVRREQRAAGRRR
ncbi:hypothetical protein [Streptomyces sp. 11x1]|uniref:hypothetical protein n=1 Tax=Streptomyces sp. 11x1 TaxID=3038642 RepID=UPI0037DA05B1